MGAQTEIPVGWPFAHISRVTVPDRDTGRDGKICHVQLTALDRGRMLET